MRRPFALSEGALVTLATPSAGRCGLTRMRGNAIVATVANPRTVAHTTAKPDPAK
jgi:hypothetical protein